MSKKSPLEGTETERFLKEQQQAIFRAKDEVEKRVKAGKLKNGGPEWWANMNLLSDWQRLHDLVEALFPAAHSDAQEKAEAIAGGTEENDDQKDDSDLH